MSTQESTSPAITEESVRSMVLDALAAIETVGSSSELKAIRQAHAGDRSPLGLANRAIGKMEPAQRKEAGQLIGKARAEVNAAFEAKDQSLAVAELEAQLEAERIDVTIPVEQGPRGAVHPVTAMIERLGDVFIGMGWEIAEGPEAEAEWYNFDALNLLPEHPARAEGDTLWIDPPEHRVLLRTSTSPVQLRTMMHRKPPVYVVSPGKVYRADEYDATHLPVFHQIEGLAVDKGLSMAHLKGTLDHLASTLFGDVVTRFRPHYFPFTEPSAELDIQCFACRGESVGNPEAPCRVCKSEGWIEWGGCGMVNPRVLQACGVDPTVYTGFAFGMGVERAIMFRNGAPDIREMLEADVRFSRSLLGDAR